MIADIKKSADDKMNKTIETLKADLGKIRTGRAHTGLLDHVMVDRILKLNGRIDARSVPSGVYVGANALGPDGLPLVPVTKFMAQYLRKRHQHGSSSRYCIHLFQLWQSAH